MLAPIVLFAYNRPEHTRRTLESLLQNPLAAQSHLYIYSDGAKNEAAEPAVMAVRKVCAEIVGFASVTLVGAEKNRGLAASIIDGVTTVVEKHGRVIVMEDDLVVSPSFLSYMNHALDTYEGDDRVMHISGASYPIDTRSLPETYFLQIPLCWGWATWRKSWQYFRKDLAVMDCFTPELKEHFNFDGSHDYWAQLERNKAGTINTWFIFWYAALALNKGLALFSRESLVQNIGFDGSGVHCGTSQVYTASASGQAPRGSLAVEVEESGMAYKRHVQFFNSVNHSRRRRWGEHVRRTLTGLFGQP